MSTFGLNTQTRTYLHVHLHTLTHTQAHTYIHTIHAIFFRVTVVVHTLNLSTSLGGRERQVGFHEFKTSLIYKESSRSAKTTK